ncbi:MAG: hypothetical protein FWG18_03220 [Alphaproteobacteria bacterium]|nr:hypothetical protein [Alphaproteobacteria bacterium]
MKRFLAIFSFIIMATFGAPAADSPPVVASKNYVDTGFAQKASAAIVSALQTDIAGKADKVADAAAGNLAGLDASGNLTNSGLPAATVANKANKQGAGTADVVAVVDAGGQYVRSGTALADLATNSSLGTAAAQNVGAFATAAQGANADAAKTVTDSVTSNGTIAKSNTAIQPAGGTITGVLNVPTPPLP